ncbi:MAG: lactate racemase domain-containing protein [Halorhabdus sp.]
MSFKVPRGDDYVEVDLPDCDVTIAELPGGEPVDVREAAQQAVADPHGPALAERADPDDDVAIVVTDVTRDAPDGVLVDVLFEELEDAGIDRDQVTIVLGLGLHRPMDDDEIEAELGAYADLAENHDPDDTVTLGKVNDVPIEIYRPVAEADLVLTTGQSEPHQYAGFSGGAKTVIIGAGGESFIKYTHGPEMLSQDAVKLGKIDGNPFREAVEEAGELVDLDFCLNVTPGPDGFLDAAAGDSGAVVRDLAETAREALAFEVDGEYDAVVSGVGAPKDAQLYQTTRGITYVVLSDGAPVKEGGRVVVPAVLDEGYGAGRGEERFYEWLSGAEDAESCYQAMLEGYEPGAQRGFVTVRSLRHADAYITNSEDPELVEECLMHAEGTVEDAIEPGSDVLVVPKAPKTLLV